MGQTLETPVQEKDINYLLQKLADKYNPLQIYWFHKEERFRRVEGCFGDFQDAGYCDYWLLMVTDGGSRIENAVQDFANAHYNFGKITILVHGIEGIERSIIGGYRFFSNVYSKGKLVFNQTCRVCSLSSFSSSSLSGGFRLHDWMSGNSLSGKSPAGISLSCPPLPRIPFYNGSPFGASLYGAAHISASDQERLRQRFEEGMSRAEGFLHGAKEQLTTKKYDVCAFMLHQAVEQCCIALIGLHMDYRCDIHNLYRLLMLCRCFSNRPYELFVNGREEDIILFDKLKKSYCTARYGQGFEIAAGELEVLMKRVIGLLEFASRFELVLCEPRLSRY